MRGQKARAAKNFSHSYRGIYKDKEVLGVFAGDKYNSYDLIHILSFFRVYG